MPRLACQTITYFETDAIQLSACDSSIVGCDIIDTAANESQSIAEQAHRDGIQLIPPHLGRRGQYALSLLENVLIAGNRFTSSGKLQCVFGSDGLNRNVRIFGNTLQTKGKHFISLSGCLTGCEIKGNVLPDGAPAPIRLDPARIAGHENIYVLSFAAPEFFYPPLAEVVDIESLQSNVVTDNRFHAFKKDASYLHNFYLYEFWDAVAKIEITPELQDQYGAQRHTKLIAELAFKFGSLL